MQELQDTLKWIMENETAIISFITAITALLGTVAGLIYKLIYSGKALLDVVRSIEEAGTLKSSAKGVKLLVKDREKYMPSAEIKALKKAVKIARKEYRNLREDKNE